jgi:hypothetical protein
MSHRQGPLCARVERSLFDAAREAAGLPPDASQGQVVRYALARLAGFSDPLSVAIQPTGFASGGDPRQRQNLSKT